MSAEYERSSLSSSLSSSGFGFHSSSDPIRNNQRRKDTSMRTKGIESLYRIRGFEKNSCLIEKTQKPGLIDVKRTYYMYKKILYNDSNNKIDTCTCI